MIALLAVVGTVIAAVIAAGATYLNGVGERQAQRQTEDLKELRVVLDNAGTQLDQMRQQFDKTRMWMAENTRLGEPQVETAGIRRERLRRANKLQAEATRLQASVARIKLRLGLSGVLLTYQRAALDASAICLNLWHYPLSSTAYSFDTDLSRFGDEVDAFFREASRLVGSRVS